MSPSLMSPLTLKSFHALPGPAKREFIAWFRNFLQVVIGSNDLEAEDTRLTHVIRGFARQRTRAGELALQDLKEILGTTDPNGHLGGAHE